MIVNPNLRLVLSVGAVAVLKESSSRRWPLFLAFSTSLEEGGSLENVI